MATLSVEPNPRVPFRVLHEDAWLVVVEKPARVATQPGLGHEGDSLLNGLFARYGPAMQNLGRGRDFGLLHRLDIDTSGLVAAALRADAYDALREAFESRRVVKRYWALVRGAPAAGAGVVRLPIEEVQGERKTARVSRSGKPAETAHRTIATGKGASLVECRLGSGRLHQIRVHLAAIGCPVLGDREYGGPDVGSMSHRLALHAFLLGLPHPETGEGLVIGSEWPADLDGATRRFGLRRPRLPTEELRGARPPEGPGWRDSAP